MKPTLEILIGDPLAGEEAHFLSVLAASLLDTAGLILANFHVGDRQIDFVVVTAAHAAILELKCFPRAVFGHRNGYWSYSNPAGIRLRYAGPNPYQQTTHQKYALSDEMKRYHEKDPGAVPGPAGRGFFSQFAAFVCIFPAIHPDSSVTPGDHKVGVRSYHEIVEELRDGAMPSSWTRADWRTFAEKRLNLTAVTLAEAIDPKIYDAHETVRAYRARVKSLFETGLPPLIARSDGTDYGPSLIAAALDQQNHFLLGPSGSAKTFHLRHLAVAVAQSGDEVPVVIEAKKFSGGHFAPVCRQATAPFFAGDLKELLQAIRLCGLRPLLLIDAVNECTESHLQDLIRGAQAFVLRFDARVILSSQHLVELPGDLKATLHHLPLPDDAQKRLIYSYHASIEATPDIDALCAGFTNSYDLTVAGRCHQSGTAPQSRADLYDRYVRRCLPRHPSTALGLLRHIADEMARTLSTAWPRVLFETTAERFLLDHQLPPTLLDELPDCRLLQLSDHSFSFEHELLLTYLRADSLRRRLGDPTKLAAELTRPRNHGLVELIIPRLVEPDAIASVLSAACDVEVLVRVIRGDCGTLAEKVVLGQCVTLMSAAIDDLTRVECRCRVVKRGEGRTGVSGVVVEGTRQWSPYDAALCEVIADNLYQPALRGAFLELLDATEWRLRVASHRGAKDAGLDSAPVWEEIIGLYGGVILHEELQLPCVAILAALREALMRPARYRGLPIRNELLERVGRRPSGHLALLTLLQDRWSAKRGDIVRENLTLVERALQSDVFIIQADALEYLELMNESVYANCPEELPRVHRMLNEVDDSNIVLNTPVLETLASYGGLDLATTPEDATAELRALISPDAASDPAFLEIAAVAGVSAATWLASRAHTCVARIFEDVFQGAYLVAYGNLSADEKREVLCLAAAAPDSGVLYDWILRELHRFGGKSALPLYERFAAGVEADTCFSQEQVALYVLGIEGCARWREAPPEYRKGDSPAHRAWKTIGEILFWRFRDPQESVEGARFAALWGRLDGQVRLAAADVLYRLSQSDWNLGRRDPRNEFTDLVGVFPRQVGPIVETCLANYESLPSLFAFPKGVDSGLTRFLIDAAERTADSRSLSNLEMLSEHPTFGARAIHAIESIKRARLGLGT